MKLLDHDIQKGITLHRDIDHFTDTHPAVKSSTKLLHPDLGKYAPVAVDIYYDYILYKNWDRYGGWPFSDLEAFVSSCLRKYADQYPPRIQARIEEMINGQFLRKYISAEGLEWTFSMVSRRTKFDSKLADAYTYLSVHEAEIESHFHMFFPEVITMAEAYCDC